MRGCLVFILGYIAGIASVCLVIYVMVVVFSFSVNSMSTNSTTYVEETVEKRVVLGWAVCGKKGAGNQCMSSVCFRRLSGSPVI